MKLVKKRNVFLSSADSVSGDKSHFSVTLPYDLGFDEKMVFKMWLSQVNIRNTFFYITETNSEYFMRFGPVGGVIPNAPTFPGGQVSAPWRRFELPYGCPSEVDVAAAINEQLRLFDGTTNLHCLYRFGRLYFTQINPIIPDPPGPGAPLANEIYFYFRPRLADGFSGPCHKAFGYSNNVLGQVQSIHPDVAIEDDERMKQLDGGSNVPGDLSQPPYLMDVNSNTEVVIKTSLPSDNYKLERSGPSSTNISVQIPIAVGPNGGIIYEDTTGVCAILEMAKSVVNILEVQVVDKTDTPMIPGHDWSFVLTIEQYEDTEKQVIQQLKDQNEETKELVQLSKMSLLQHEFLEHK
jgi:hypothetical protein